MRTSAWWVGALLLWGACTFDREVDPAARIQCETRDDCPPGWRCSQARGVCAQTTQDDTTGPVLEGEVSPSLVRAGQPVTVRVRTNEPLAAFPTLVVEHGGVTRSEADAGYDGDGGYVFQLNAPEVTDERYLTVFAQGEDQWANVTPRALIGAVKVDGKPPVPTQLSVTPSVVAAGVPVFVTLSFDEPVTAASVLVEGRLLPATVPPGSSTGSLTFKPAAGASRPIEIELVSAVDVAGNVSNATRTAKVTLDVDGPEVSDLVLDAGRYSAMPGHNTLVVPLGGIVDAEQVSVCVEGLVPPCQEPDAGATESVWQITDTMDGGTTPRFVLVSAVDGVGNRTQASTTVIFDFDAPAVVDATTTYVRPPQCPTLQLTALGLGGELAVRWTVDEELSAASPPVVTMQDLRFDTPVRAADSARVWTVVGHPAAMMQSRRANPSVWLQDQVGNGALRLLSSITLDAEPPTGAGLGAGLRYLRAPWGINGSTRPLFRVSGPAGSFEPGSFVRVLSVTDGGGPQVLTQTLADADGGLPDTELLPLDFNAVAFEAFDLACNQSPPQVVPQVDWVVNMQGKEPGVLAPNPHRFLGLESVIPTSREELSAREWGRAELGAADTQSAVLRGSGMRWFRVGGTIPTANCVVPTRSGVEAWYDETVAGQLLRRHAVLDLGRRAWLVDAVESTFVPAGACASRGDGYTLGLYGQLLLRSNGLSWSWSLLPSYTSEQSVGVDPTSGRALWLASTPSTMLQSELSDGGWQRESFVDAGRLYQTAVLTLQDTLVVTGCEATDCAGPRQTWFRVDGGWSAGESSWTSNVQGLACPDVARQALMVLGNDAGQVLLDGGWRSTPRPFATAPSACVVTTVDGGPTLLAVSDTGEVSTWNGAQWSSLQLAAGARGEGRGPETRQVLTNEPGGAPLWLSATDAGAPAPLAYSWADGGWRTTSTSLPALQGPAAAWNASTGQLLVVSAEGGYLSSGGPLAPVSAPMGLLPRQRAAIASLGNGFVVFGGQRGTQSLNDTWLWDGQWTQYAPPMMPTVQVPEPRIGAAIAEVPMRGAFLFGGQSPALSVAPDPDEPPVGLGLRSASGSGGGASVGGSNAPIDRADTWLWTTANGWNFLSTQGRPAARSGASLVWDAVNGRLVLMGGVGRRDTWWMDVDEFPITWREWTGTAGAVPLGARATWSPADNAVMLNSSAETWLLLPFGVPAHRFVPNTATLNLPPGASLQSLDVDLVSSGAVERQLWDGQRWVGVSDGGLGPVEAERFLNAGLQWVPVGGRQLSTNYVQVTLRYRP